MLLATVDVLKLLNTPLGIAAGGVLAVLVTVLLLKLADYLDAKAAASKGLAATAEHDGAAFARLLAGFLKTNGQDVKDLADPAKRAAAEAHLVSQAKAAVQAALTGAKVLLLVICASFFACAHADPLIDTGNALDATTALADATSKAMDAAVRAHEITPETYAKWQAFLPYFRTSYDLAVAEWKSAEADQNETTALQAKAALATLLLRLADFEALVVAGPTQTDGGVK